MWLFINAPQGNILCLVFLEYPPLINLSTYLHFVYDLLVYIPLLLVETAFRSLPIFSGINNNDNNNINNNKVSLRNPEVEYHIHKASPIIPVLSRINPIPRIEIHFFKVHSYIVLPFTSGPS